jgi:hypothetical protein
MPEYAGRCVHACNAAYTREPTTWSLTPRNERADIGKVGRREPEEAVGGIVV